MSANLFEENKTNKKDNPILQITNKPEDDDESNINNQEKQNSIFNNSMIMKIINILMDKISKLGYSSNKEGELFGNINNNQRSSLFGNKNNQTGSGIFLNNINTQKGELFGISNNESNSLFGNSIDQKIRGLFGNNGNNQGNSLFGNRNQGDEFFGNNNFNKQVGLFCNNTDNQRGLFGNINNIRGDSAFINNTGNQGRELLGDTNNNKKRGLFESNQSGELFNNISNNKDDNQGISLFENCFNNQGGSLFGSGNLNQNDERNNSSKLFANNINNNTGNSLFGDKNTSNNSLFGQSNNLENSLFGNSKINYNQTQGLFGNSTNQENNEKYSPYEDSYSDNIINELEYNNENDKDENNLAKDMEEIEDGKNINVSIIKNQEKQNSIFSNSIINELKDIIPEISTKNENELLNEEIMEIYKYYQFFLNYIGNNYNICKKCGKNNYFFCENCSINLCDICSKDCKEKHQNKLIKLKDKIDFFKNEIEKIIQEYYKNKIIDEPIKKSENDIIVIKLIIDSNYNNYFHYKIIKNFYNYMKIKYDINNQILIEYKIESNKRQIKIFGYEFVKNNKGKCFIIYEDKKFELTENFELKNKANNNILKIKLIGINNVIDMRQMFYNCSSLISLPDISKWNTNNVTNMSEMFSDCYSLIYLHNMKNFIMPSK